MIHHLYTPPTYPEAVNVLTARRDCKETDAGLDTETQADVTCPRCLRNIQEREDWAWKTKTSKCIAEDLSERIVQGQKDGYGVWHERAGSACLAAVETLERTDVTILWYCKITPVPERFVNAGFLLSVNYGKSDGVIHAVHDEWMPPDADTYLMDTLIRCVRSSLATAIAFGVNHALVVK